MRAPSRGPMVPMTVPNAVLNVKVPCQMSALLVWAVNAWACQLKNTTPLAVGLVTAIVLPLNSVQSPTAKLTGGTEGTLPEASNPAATVRNRGFGADALASPAVIAVSTPAANRTAAERRALTPTRSFEIVRLMLPPWVRIGGCKR